MNNNVFAKVPQPVRAVLHRVITVERALWCNQLQASCARVATGFPVLTVLSVRKAVLSGNNLKL